EDGVTDDRSFRANCPARVQPRKADCIKTDFSERMPGFSSVACIHAIRAHGHKHISHRIHPGAVSGGLTFGKLPGFSSVMRESRCCVRPLWLLVVTADGHAAFARRKHDRKNSLAGRPMRDRSL